MTGFRITSVGIELEGYWHRRPDDVYGGDVRRDSSVQIYAEPGGHVGEVTSPIFTRNTMHGGYEAAVMLPRRVTLSRWIKDCYPDEVNSSCGLHVHLGFLRFVANRFMPPFERAEEQMAIAGIMAEDPNFCDYLIQGLLAWRRRRRVRSTMFTKRIKGENSYCKKNPADTTAATSALRGGQYADRYQMVNYCSFGRHKTVEIRVLPMFKNSKHAISAIYRVIALADYYLLKHPHVADVKVPLTIAEDMLPLPLEEERRASAWSRASLTQRNCSVSTFPFDAGRTVAAPAPHSPLYKEVSI